MRPLCATLGGEGFWGGHTGPWFHRTQFGFDWWDSNPDDFNSNALLRAKWSGPSVESKYENPQITSGMFLVFEEDVTPEPRFKAAECKKKLKWFERGTIDNATECYKSVMADDDCGKRFMTMNPVDPPGCACYPVDMTKCDVNPNILNRLTWDFESVSSSFDGLTVDEQTPLWENRRCLDVIWKPESKSGDVAHCLQKIIEKNYTDFGRQFITYNTANGGCGCYPPERDTCEKYETKGEQGRKTYKLGVDPAYVIPSGSDSTTTSGSPSGPPTGSPPPPIDSSCPNTPCLEGTFCTFGSSGSCLPCGEFQSQESCSFDFLPELGMDECVTVCFDPTTTSATPTGSPSSLPTGLRSILPSDQTSGQPSTHPSTHPSTYSSTQPSTPPSSKPSSQPSVSPIDTSCPNAPCLEGSFCNFASGPSSGSCLPCGEFPSQESCHYDFLPELGVNECVTVCFDPTTAAPSDSPSTSPTELSDVVVPDDEDETCELDDDTLFRKKKKSCTKWVDNNGSSSKKMMKKKCKKSHKKKKIFVWCPVTCGKKAGLGQCAFLKKKKKKKKLDSVDVFS